MLRYSSIFNVNRNEFSIVLRNFSAPAEPAPTYKNVEQKSAYIKQIAAHQSEMLEKPADWDTAKPFSDIPGPKAIPVLGNIWRFFPGIGTYYGLDQISQHRRFIKEFGPIVKLSGLKVRPDIVLNFDPDSMEKLYRNEGVWPHREGLESLIYYKLKVRNDIFQGQGGVLTGHGEEWYYARSIVNPPMMQPRSAQQYIGVMDDTAMDFIERMKFLAKQSSDGVMPEDFSNELNKWSLESICAIGLNKRLGLLNPDIPPNSEAQQFINDVLDIFLLLNDLDVKISFWKLISTPKWRKYVKTLDRVTKFQKKHLDEAIEKFENNNDKNKSESELSILEQLLKRDKKVAFAMVFDMLIAGIDTTSRTTAAALYFLCKNQDAQSKLREEIRNKLPNKNSPITKEVLTNIPYLRAVIKETTRLAPIAIGNLRRTPKDIVLQGYQIPKGVDVINAHMFMCRQDKYFPRASEFIPDRWLREGAEEYISKDAHPFVLMPFGFGPRSCIGRRLAQLEIEIILARLTRNFEFTWPHEDMKWEMNMLYGVGSPLRYQVKSIEN